VTPNPFEEEAARILGDGSAGTPGGLPADGPSPAGEPSQPSGWPDQQGPVIESQEQPGRPRRAWPWVLVTILVVALAVTAWVIVSNRSDAAGPHFDTVPGVVGLPEATAIKKIRAAGFGYYINGRQPSADVKEGAVLRQDTAGGAKLERGGTVGIWISSGTGQVEVPNVVGLTQAEATEKLDGVGLEVMVRPEIGSDVEVGRVLRQNPEAGKKVDAGTTAAITVAAVTNTVKVPPLTGMTQETAVALLKGMNLVADAQKVDSVLPGGIVDHQDPASASEVQPGTKVKLFVSNAATAKTVFVPAVGALGLTETEAKAILAKYHLKAQVIDLETPDFKAGLCIYQDPAAGAEVKVNSVVNLTVAREPTSTTTTAPPFPSGANRYDQADTRIVKTGVWVDYYVTAAYLGSYGRSSTVGASATIYFTGTRLDWIAMNGTTTGVAVVYLDGVKKTTINLAATAARYLVNVWSTGNLPRGRHQVSIVLSSSSPAGKYLTLDAVDIWGTIRTGP
jgi:beta-lactam-binding protein with PASTA domain